MSVHLLGSFLWDRKPFRVHVQFTAPIVLGTSGEEEPGSVGAAVTDIYHLQNAAHQSPKEPKAARL